MFYLLLQKNNYLSCLPMKKLVLTLLSFLTTTTLIYAVDWTGNSGGGNWNIGSNWTGGAVPGSGDAVFIRTSDTVFQNAQDREMGRLSLGITSGGTTHLTPTLNVGEFGGSLTTGVGPTNTNNWGQNASGTTTFNLKGGGFTATNFTQIGAGTGNMEVNVSAGAFNLADTNVGMTSGGTASLNVIGDAATLQLGRTNFGSGGTLSFEFGADGVSSVSMNYLNAAGATLLVDLTDYTGAAGTFTIVDANSDNVGSGLISAFSTVTITEGAYVGSSISQNLGTHEIVLTVIPEPRSIALLGGLFALFYVMARRR